MNDQLPIACTLGEAALEERVAEMGAIGAEALIESAVDGRRAELRFRPDAAVRARLDAVVAAESQCCAFLAMTLRDEPDAVVLEVTAPAGAEPVVEGMAGAFSRAGGRSPAPWRS